jgi:tRNA dimethylallyltransferase
VDGGKLLIICGPTGVGKTGLGLKLAREFNGEIVSADSRQVYRGMDVVTGKDVGNSEFRIQNPELQEKVQRLIKQKIQVGIYKVGRVPIWGLDLVEPDEEFSVAVWRRVAREIVKDIWKRGKLPIVVGGTGLYLKALTEPLEEVEAPRDLKLRKVLKDKRVEELFNILEKEDPGKAKRMNESDRKNPRRLVRVLEIACFKSRKSDLRSQNKDKESILGHPEFISGSGEILNQVQNDGVRWRGDLDSIWIGLRCDSLKELYERIDGRVEERLADERIVGELESLLEKGYLKYAPAVTIGYQQLIKWMGGELTFGEMMRDWKFAEHGYARRQMTWFRKNKEIEWFEVGERGWERTVGERIGRWLLGEG